MGNLTNKLVKDTYDGLIKLQDETSGVKATLQPLQDGLGNNLPIQVSSTEVVITGSFSGDGSNLTGITSTNAVSASHAIFAESALSASYAENVDLPSGVVSGSAQISDLGFATTSSVTSLSSSVADTDLAQDGRLGSLETESGSIRGDFNSFTSSQASVDSVQDGRLGALETETGSLQSQINSKLDSSSFNTFTSSQAGVDSTQDGRLGSLETESGSIRGDFNSFTSSQSSVDSVQDGRLSSLETESGSLQTEINTKLNTSSFNTFTSSQSGVDSAQDGRLNSIEEKTGSYATTGSNLFVGLQQINNDLIIQGNLYVSGSETILSSSTLIIGDREIELNANRTVGNSGIIVYDVVSPEGTGSFQYDVTNNYWIAGQFGTEERIITSDMTSSMSVQSSVSSSHSVNSDTSVSSSFSQTAISSSHSINSDNSISSSHAIFAESSLSSSYADNALSASHSQNSDNAISSSHSIFAESSLSSSHSQNSDNSISSSHAIFAETSLSSSHAIFAETAGNSLTTDSALRTSITAKNVTGTQILKGTPCYITGSGTAGNLVGVIPADAGNPSLMPAGVVLNETLDAGDEGEAIVVGFIGGVNTSAFASGDDIYVAVGGGYTNVKPTGSALIQKLGNVEKSDVVGSGVINGAGRSNDIPNIQEGYIWVGNSDQVATPISTGSFARRDEVNIFTQNQVITGSISQSGSLVNSMTRVQIANSNKPFFGEANTLLSLVGDSQGIFDFYADGGNYDTLNINLVQNSGTTFRDWTGAAYSEWLKIPTNTGTNPAPQFQRGLGITGSLIVTNGITGSLFGTASYATEALSASFAPMPDVSFFATTGSNTFIGNQTITGSVNISGNTISVGSMTQNIIAPATNQEVDFIKVNNAVVAGKAYNRAVFGMFDFPSFGQVYEDYFAIEYWDSAGYNFGSEITVNGKQSQIFTRASGSNNTSIIRTTDNYDGTTFARVNSTNRVEILSPQIRIGRTLGSEILIEGSVQQWVSGITISSATASVDFSKSNFQTLTLASGVATHITPINMSPGQSVVVEITQDGTSAGTVTFDSSITFPGGTPYAPTTTLGGKDVLTLVTFDGIVARGAGQNDFS